MEAFRQYGVLPFDLEQIECDQIKKSLVEFVKNRLETKHQVSLLIRKFVRRKRKTVHGRIFEKK